MAFIMPILRVGKLKLEVKELVRDRTAQKSSWAQTRPVLRITAPRTASGCDEAPDPGRPRRGSLHGVGSVAQAGLGAAGV